MSQTKLRRSKMCMPCSSSTFFHYRRCGAHRQDWRSYGSLYTLVRSGHSYDVTSQGEKKSNSVAILWRDTRAKSTDGDEWMHAGLDPAWACKVCRDSLDLGPMNDVRIAAAMRLGRCDAEMTQANLAPQLHA